jgi:predicted RecA/RadA family phage recombinase
MAKNRVYRCGDELSLACTDPATPASGDPVVIGQIPGVALVSEDSAGNTSVALEGVFNLLVAGIDNSGTSGADANKAVAVGDIIYYGTGDTPKLSKRADGVQFGYALGTVASGATTTTIAVKIHAA